MENFNAEERRHFVEFLTGRSRLPLGGFAGLVPPLTVVRKEVEAPDRCLPSVMTCQNYLKLPEYSSIEVLEQRIKYAMLEGRLSFHLS